MHNLFNSHSLVVAVDGVSALETANKEAINLILLDIKSNRSVPVFDKEGRGGCPRIEAVARESCFESDFSIF